MVHETRWRRGCGRPLDFHEKLSGWRELTEKRVQTGVNRVFTTCSAAIIWRHKSAGSAISLPCRHQYRYARTQINSGPYLQVQTIGRKNLERTAPPVDPGVSGTDGRPRPAGRGTAEPDRLLPVAGLFRLKSTSTRSGRRNPGSNRLSDHPEYPPQIGEYAIDGNHFFDNDASGAPLYYAGEFSALPFGRYSPQMLDRDLETIRDLYHCERVSRRRREGRDRRRLPGVGKATYRFSLDVQEGPAVWWASWNLKA